MEKEEEEEKGSENREGRTENVKYTQRRIAHSQANVETLLSIFAS